MKLFKLTAFIMAAIAMVACDDTTETIGSSITNNVDNLTISDAAFNVTSRSLEAGAVLSKSNNGIIGKVKDPETSDYLTANYMTQVAPLSSFGISKLDSIVIANMKAANVTVPSGTIDPKDYIDYVDADSCFLLVSYQSTFGDTLAPMRVTAYEMSKPIEEGKDYYSDFDPMAEGYVSKSNYHASATYTLDNTNDNFKIFLNKPYTKDGKTYKNYGSYIMQTYVEHPEYFKSNYTFLNKVCPGFYIKHEGGIGNVADIWNTEVQFYYKYNSKNSDGTADSIKVSWNRFDGTEEVLQNNHISYNEGRIAELVNNSNASSGDGSYTYLKSPAGIFTELTLPVEDIISGHENDTINTATVILPRINNENTDVDEQYQFDTPLYILMIPKDSLNSFFENGDLVNNRTSFYATYAGVNKNAYTFSNISNLVTAMNKVAADKRKNADGTDTDWNKVVLIPVTISTVTENSSTVISKITHNMSLTSTKLVKGEDTYETKDGKEVPTGKIQIKVIYSKFKEK